MESETAVRKEKGIKNDDGTLYSIHHALAMQSGRLPLQRGKANQPPVT
jgi:hypothetical protein